MSRLRIETPDQAQLTVERLYKDLERHIIASPRDCALLICSCRSSKSATHKPVANAYPAV